MVLAGFVTAAIAADLDLLDLIARDKPNAPVNKVHAFRVEDPRLTEGLSVFANPSNDSQADAGVRAALLKSPHTGSEAGEEVVIDLARRLMVSEGTSTEPSFELFAAPTTLGNVCLLDKEPSGLGTSCVRRLDPSRPISIGVLQNGELVTVFGIAADNVSGVDLHFGNGHSESAMLGTNAYMWRSRTGVRPDGVSVKFEDGSEARVGWDGVIAN
jgi:hypothetical protein